ncbi:Mediator of RNA polymerase II transcription subunit 33A [Apostasia shenzhenica]|uniref:Reticulon-like protein n=1 Tax=Apostasia shenzhenica TaxID=1088818 RepID=A0A2I0B1Y4_9ASPA|nr:Mediator of RNA polymerase II transcription subunit 33A [Apostasia shenzhenica]
MSEAVGHASLSEKIHDKIHEYKRSSSSSDSENDEPLFVNVRKKRLFGRKDPVHTVLGGGKSADIMLWRNKPMSGGILAGVTVIWLLFEWMDYHLLTFICHSLIFFLAALFLWSNAASFINRDPPKFPEVILSEEMFLTVAQAARFQINEAFATFRFVAMGKDLKNFLLDSIMSTSVEKPGFASLGCSVHDEFTTLTPPCAALSFNLSAVSCPSRPHPRCYPPAPAGKRLAEDCMDAAGVALADLERRVMAAVKASDESGEPPLIRVMEAACCAGAGAGPSPELGQVLVSSLCFGNNTPSLWKLLNQAIAVRLVSPLHIVALLTARVIPHRRVQPEAYRLYLELMSRHGMSFSLLDSAAQRDKITKSIDEALHLSRAYGLDKIDFGHAVIFFVLTIITRLMDAILEDLGMKFVFSDKDANIYVAEDHQDMEIDSTGNLNDKRKEHRDQLRKSNTLMALEVVEKIMSNKKNKAFLHIIHLNMPEKFNGLVERFKFVEVHKSTSQSLISVKSILEKLLANIQEVLNEKFNLHKHHGLDILVDTGFGGPTAYYSVGADRSGCWISFDMFMENAMDGRHLYAISSVEILTGAFLVRAAFYLTIFKLNDPELTKALQVANQASWQETFMALWVSALRLVQRDREPWEGPVPHLDARLCMLLSIVPLAIVSIVKELDPACARSNYGEGMDANKPISRRFELVSSLQVLQQYTGLLLPPPSVVNAANNAASKAATFIANFRNGSGSLGATSQKDTSIKAAGNMLHLIVEACIARKLIDTSAYFWPGYVSLSAASKDSILVEASPWSSFMEGGQLSGSLKNALITTPAPSVVELEKLYYTALNGTEEEKPAAAKILCSASLIRGWNIQEHVVRMVVKLLSPPISPEISKSETSSHLMGQMPMISAVLFSICSVETVHIISFYGMIPEMAAALMPLCEAFGSVPPQPSYRTSLVDESSIYSVFSCAFLVLLRLWKFYKPPQEHYIAGRGGTVMLELTLDYLLLMHNHRIEFPDCGNRSKLNSLMDSSNISIGQAVYIDSFPKLRAWYLQNQACIASTLSGLCSKNPVHQVANKILNMICRKMTKGGSVPGNPSSTSSSSISGSPVNTAEDVFQRPLFPAWDILEAVPFVLEAILTACAHGRLSSRDLTTGASPRLWSKLLSIMPRHVYAFLSFHSCKREVNGLLWTLLQWYHPSHVFTGLRDLVDFFPASLATIISYFLAEITRGIWQPVSMNGIDWPSPAANLLSIESEIKEILASAGVMLPDSCSSLPGGAVPMLPLPMAALVSLTITFKLDKSLEYVHDVIGQALENCSAGSPWPSMPIIGALWTQKVRRWHDFVVLSCTRSPFTRDKDAVAQLIRSCFSFFSCPANSSLPITTHHCSVSRLLGHSISDKGLRLAPGYLYLRSCRAFYDTHFVNNVILRLVVECSGELAAGRASAGLSTARLLSSRSSLAAAASAVRQVATLGASLVCIAGGPLLVQVLYEETVPSALLSGSASGGPAATAARLLEGYAIAYMVVLSGSFVWGVGKTSPAFKSLFSSRRARSVGIHLEFIAGGVEGNVSVGCDPTTWRAYVSCLVGLLVRNVPAWVPEARLQALRKLAAGLRRWHEWELALALLERGGPSSVELVVESIISSSSC